MDLSALEKHVLTDLVQDAHELWELYAFVRDNHPEITDVQVIKCGHDLLTSWVQRGWLSAQQTRMNNNPLAPVELLAAVDKLGMGAADPEKGTILLSLTERAVADVDWLPKNITPSLP